MICRERACNRYLTTIYMFDDIICITNRKIFCTENGLEPLSVANRDIELSSYNLFLKRIGDIADKGPRAIILREKDMSRGDYCILAKDVQDICNEKNVNFICHSFVDVAMELGIKRIHLPIGIFRNLMREEKEFFEVVGVSCHSYEEAEEVTKNGADYITASHVFATDCKKGLAPRGLDFLWQISRNIDIKVFALGGIKTGNMAEVMKNRVEGVCIMSEFMGKEL